MAKEDASNTEAHREKAASLLEGIDKVLIRHNSENAGTIAALALAHAVLAIHGELSAIRKKYRPEDAGVKHTASVTELQR
jgi:hypothetical protein